MEIIPVIDLLGGRVVHAVRGERSRYQPLSSQLSESSDPVTVMEALLGVYPFPTIYIADLDAISDEGDHEKIIHSLMEIHDSIEFWVDRGITRLDDLNELQYPRQRHVIGSEAGVGAGLLSEFKNAIPDMILSLDFRQGTFLGDRTVLQQADIWPNTILVMNLDRVGTDSGPDLDLLGELKSRAVDRNWYAAGGIRNSTDLEVLRDHGASGALIASSLHSGKIRYEDLAIL